MATRSLETYAGVRFLMLGRKFGKIAGRQLAAANFWYNTGA